MDVTTAIQKRRSIRKYQSKPISKELLTFMMEMARFAPSGANRQPWHLVVVTDPEKLRELVPICKDQRFVGECSAFIAGIDDPTQKWARVDLAIALENIALAAVETGLGTCYVGAFDQVKLAAALGVPEGLVVTVGMTLGFPDEAPEARTRKSLNELVHWESYS